jgi:dynein assembly factor 5
MEDKAFSEGSKYLIKRNLKNIINVILEEISDFKQPTALKLKSISVLYHLIRGAGDLINPYVDKVLLALYHHSDDEELSPKCAEVAQMIGLHTDQNISIPTIAKHLTETDIKNAYQPLTNRLFILSNVLAKTANISDESVSTTLKVLYSLDLFNLPENNQMKNILKYTFRIYESLILNLQKNCSKFHSDLFLPLLFLGSLNDTKELHNEVAGTMQQLAIYCGFESVIDLYSLELSFILDKFNNTHKQWRRNSPDRYAFDTYVRNGGIALEKHWQDILFIISNCCEADRDIEMRMEMLELMESIIEDKGLTEDVSVYIEFIIKEILLPATAWRTQRPNYNVRKGALTCIIKLFKYNIIDLETSLKFVKDIFKVLKSTLEDDWDPELRNLSMLLVKYMLLHTKENISTDDLTDFYPNLLKRLDDSQDSIRILTSQVLKIFFQIIKKKTFSLSAYEYIVNTAFIHLDDPKEEMRLAVFDFLKEAALVNKESFLKIAEKNMSTFSHVELCKELIEFSDNN